MYQTYAVSSLPGACRGELKSPLPSPPPQTVQLLERRQTNSIVTVNISADLRASFAGKANYVEVIVQSNLNGSFGVTITGQKLVVRARSVAKGRPMAVGLLAALSPTAAGSTDARRQRHGQPERR